MFIQFNCKQEQTNCYNFFNLTSCLSWYIKHILQFFLPSLKIIYVCIYVYILSNICTFDEILSSNLRTWFQNNPRKVPSKSWLRKQALLVIFLPKNGVITLALHALLYFCWDESSHCRSVQSYNLQISHESLIIA